jgi:hypothetical protein
MSFRRERPSLFLTSYPWYCISPSKQNDNNNLINFETDYHNDSPADPAGSEVDDDHVDTNFYKPAALQLDPGNVGCSTRRRRQDWRLKTQVVQDRDRGRVVVDL